MATGEVEDDESWLYGDGEAPNKKETGGDGDKGAEGGSSSKLSAEATPFEPKEDKTENNEENEEGKEAGEVSGEDGENKDEEDGEEEEDSDDDVQVTIGDIKTQSSYEPQKFKSTYQRLPTQSQQKQPVKGVDVETTGNINGVSVYEFDLDSLQADEKPWRKPGADITDYFNYGFTEETWRHYTEKQRRCRYESGANKVFVHVHHSTGPPPIRQEKPAAEPIQTTDATGDPNLTSPFNRRAGPPPGRKVAGTIDVIGGTTRDSRRPMREYDVPSGEAQDFNKFPAANRQGPPMPTTPVHMPPPDFGRPPPGPGQDFKKYTVPPPGTLPPTHLPPPDYNAMAAGPVAGPPPPGPVPPPHMGVPPPVFYPPPGGPPPDAHRPGFDNRPPAFGYSGAFGGPPPGFGGPPPAGPGWDNRGPPGGYNPSWDYHGSPPRSDSDFSSSEDERLSRGGYRGRELYDPFEREQRDWDTREYYNRPRDRSRSKDRDRERRHRDREERHRSKRKHQEGSGDQPENSRSKHKKSKRSRRERDEKEAVDTSTSQAEESAT